MRISKRQWRWLLFLIWIPLAPLAALTPRIIARFHASDEKNEGPVHLKVDLSERRLYMMQGDKVIKKYGVAIGTRKYPTPTGTFRTGRIVWNPGWTPPPRKWARNERPRRHGDPRNPMQGVKIYFREPYYFIHGTNAPGSIGRAASHGCLRMRTSDARALARRIAKQGSATLTIVR